MATGIPLPGEMSEALRKGVDTGSNMFARIMHSKYSNGLHPSGDVSNALYVEQMKDRYGENDPRYIEAKRAHEMSLSGRQSLMDYRTSLNQTAGIRNTSPLGKLMAEGQGRGAIDILNGNASSQVTSGQPQNAKFKVGEQYYDNNGEPVYKNTNPRTEQEKKAYEQAIAKNTTDAAVRNKIPYAENVKITLDSIDPQALVQYSGPQGSYKLGIDSLKAAFGTPPPEFLEYQKALTSSKTLSKQLRQFWGDSIQPAATDKIDQLTNPSTWKKNPEVALQQFNQLKKITDLELETFKTAGTSPIKLDFKDGNFVTDNKQTENKTNKNNIESKEDDALLLEHEPILIKINPKYTSKNIKDTAAMRKISVGEVIDQLIARGK